MSYPLLEKMLEDDTTPQKLKAEIKSIFEKLKDLNPFKTIRNLTDEFVKIARTKKIPLYYDNESGVDTNIFARLPDAVVTETPSPTGEWEKVDSKKGVKEGKMLDTAVKMPLAQAIAKFTEMVKNGEFDKKNTHRVIFLIETEDDSPLKLVCRRCSVG